MASIAIRDLKLAGHSLLSDNESYLNDLSNESEMTVVGGFAFIARPTITMSAVLTIDIPPKE